MDQPLVSIICNTYNQVSYIRDALDSFLMQKTSFPVEILVHDDASPDGTADVVRSYAERYPDRVFPILQTENQTRQGAKITLDIQAPRARGRFIAFCEGDDYWTDPDKLQKQVDALLAHPGVDACAHAADEVHAETKKVLSVTAPADRECILTTEQVILGGGEYVATNSLLFRAEILQKPSRALQSLSLDYTMQIMGALRGGLYYLPDVMSAHRVSADSSWSAKAKKDPGIRIRLNRRIAHMFELLNEDTENRFAETVNARLRIQEAQDLYAEERFRALKQPQYREFYNGLSRKEKLYVNLNLYAPALMKLRKKLRGA